MGENYDGVAAETDMTKIDKATSELHDAMASVLIQEKEELKLGEWIEIDVVSSEQMEVVDEDIKRANERSGMEKEQPSQRQLRRNRGQTIQTFKSDKSYHILSSYWLSCDANDELNVLQILELQLITNNSTDGPLVDVNSMDERDYTALDVDKETSSRKTVWGTGIHLIVINPGAAKRGLSSSSLKPEKQSSRIPIKVINLLLMVFVMAATILLAASCNPPNAFQQANQGKNATVSIWDMVIGPSQFQVIFYYMICSMVGFIVSMGIILVLLWPLPYRKVTTFVLAILMAVYILLVDINTPKFTVTMGNSRIASGLFMGLCAAIFVLCGSTALILVKVRGHYYRCTSEEVACEGLFV